MDWYKKDIPAYRRATRHLTPLENGIYDRLLTECYATEGALPDDLRYLAQVCGCVSPGERKGLVKVLNQYFVKNGDGTWHNARADEEISDFKAMCDANRTAARTRHALRAQSTTSAPRITEREKERKKEERPAAAVDKSTCKHRNPDGSFCGKHGTHKVHPLSQDWFCNDHPDG